MGAAEFQLRGVASVMLPSRGTGRWPVAKATSPKVKWVVLVQPCSGLGDPGCGTGWLGPGQRSQQSPRVPVAPRSPVEQGSVPI